MIGQSGPSLLNHPSAAVEPASEEPARGGGKSENAGAFAKVLLVGEGPAAGMDLEAPPEVRSIDPSVRGAASAAEATAPRARTAADEAFASKAALDEAVSSSASTVIVPNEYSVSADDFRTNVKSTDASKYSNDFAANANLVARTGDDQLTARIAAQTMDGIGASKTITEGPNAPGRAPSTDADTDVVANLATPSVTTDGSRPELKKREVAPTVSTADDTEPSNDEAVLAADRKEKTTYGATATEATGARFLSGSSYPGQVAPTSDLGLTSLPGKPSFGAENLPASGPKAPVSMPVPTGLEPEAKIDGELAPPFGANPKPVEAAAASTEVPTQSTPKLSAATAEVGKGSMDAPDSMARQGVSQTQAQSAILNSAQLAEAGSDTLQTALQATSNGTAEFDVAVSDMRRAGPDRLPLDGANRPGEQGPAIVNAQQRGSQTPDQRLDPTPAPSINNVQQQATRQDVPNSPASGTAHSPNDATRAGATSDGAGNVVQRPSTAPQPGLALSALTPSLSDVQQLGQVALAGPAPAGLAIAEAQAAPPAQSAADPKAVSQQITQAIVRLDGARTEVTLDPVELGRVSLTFVTKDEGITVIVTADRPETADLLRRNSDQLQRDLSNVGYEGVELDFDGNHDDRRAQFAEDKRDRIGGSGEEAATLQLVRLETGLDIRI